MEHNDPEDVPAKRGDLKTATSLKPTDESFRIDLMSSQLGKNFLFVLVFLCHNCTFYYYYLQHSNVSSVLDGDGC